MEGVEHLGQYVYEMTNTRLQQLRAEQGLPAEVLAPQAAALTQAGEDGADVVVREVDEEEEEDQAPVRAEGFEAEEND
jgi:intron-binding protein aquarius